MPNNEDAPKTFAIQEDADNNTSAIPQNELNTNKKKPGADDATLQQGQEDKKNDLTGDEEDKAN